MKNVDLSVIEASEKMPPVHLWKPELCGDMDLVIRANGEWIHEGAPMKRASMRKMFSRILWLEDGEHYLVTPHEKVRIQVEDAPFLVTQSNIERDSNACLVTFTTNVDDVLVLGKGCDLWVEKGPEGDRPYLSMRYGMKAMLHRSVYYDLVNNGYEKEIEGKQHVCIESAGKEFSLGVFDT